ncbi:MAG TPA: enoyl-CoA hydratase-related protein [Pseudonocardia sp.]|jgi:enoyl-CoA hydratase|nr:enoyl-CoA hydratase-related protein [Pseudonocardia sp.]
MKLDELTTMRVEFSPDRHVAEVVLDNGHGNPMGVAFWQELPHVWPALHADPDVRAILLRGEGRHFCSGVDLRDAQAIMGPAGGDAAAREKFLAWLHMAQSGITALETCAKPVVAAVHGACIGGGVDLICAADIRLASAEAVFCVKEVRVAIVSDGGSLQRLPTLIGESAARRLLLTGEDFDAARAERYGLVSDVYPDPATLLTEAREMCRRLASLSPRAVQGTKQTMNLCRDMTHAQGLEYIAAWNSAFLVNADLTEMMTAFAEGRPPRY